MNLALRSVVTARQSYRLLKHPVINSTVRLIPNITLQNNLRFYSDERTETTLPTLMEFPPIVWPSVIKFIKNWMFANFIIRPYFEQEFNLPEFIEASKHAVQVVSQSLQNSDFKALEGLVDKDAVVSLKSAVTKLSVSQRQLLGVDKDDIFYAFPYQVGVMFDDADKRWVEITMCYHVMKGLKEELKDIEHTPMMSMGNRASEEKYFILNYRFIREFTKGVEDSWWVNIVNHFQPHTMIKKFNK